MPDQPGHPQTFSAWEDVLGALRTQITPHQFRTWLSGVRARWEGEERLVLDAGSSFRAEVLTKRYSDRIARTVLEVCGRAPASIVVESAESETASNAQTARDAAPTTPGSRTPEGLKGAVGGTTFSGAYDSSASLDSQAGSSSSALGFGPDASHEAALDAASGALNGSNGRADGRGVSGQPVAPESARPAVGERRSSQSGFERTLARIKRRRDHSQGSGVAGTASSSLQRAGTGFAGGVSAGLSHSALAAAPSARPAQQPLKRAPVARLADDPETPLNPEFTADHWIEDESNRLATLAARSVTMSQDRLYNPLVIVGSIGVGKSHLCQMVVRDQRQAAPGTRIRYATGEQFVNEFLGSLERKAMGNFRSRFRGLDLLVIDDLESLAHKERSQLEFLNVLNNLTLGGRQVVVSLPATPDRIAGFSDQLKSRLSGGMVCRVELPDRGLRTRLAAATAERLGESLPEEVLRFIADSAARSSREVKGAAIRLVAQARFTKRLPDLESCTRVLGDLVTAAKRRVHIGGVIDAVCEDYGVSRKDLEGRDRTRAICEPRQLCMTLARDLTPHSLAEIGSALGRRDHSTVLHGIERTRARLRSASDAELAARYARLKAVLDPTAH